MLLLTLSLFASAEECPSPVSPDRIASLSQDATLAWVAMDEDGFSELVAQVEAEVPCLSAPVSPALAAEVHGIRGVRAFLNGDTELAKTHFRAADSADPKYRLSERIAPRGGKLQRLHADATSGGRTPGNPLELLDGGTIWVDGVAGGPRSEARPALVQVGAGDQAVWSTLLEPGAAFAPPPMSLSDLPSTPSTPEAPRASGGGKGTALWAAAGGSGATAAALFGTSAYLRTRYDAAPSQGLHGATNGTFVASTGMAVLTGGLLTAAIVRSKRTSR